MEERRCDDCRYFTTVLSGDYQWCNVDGQDRPIDRWDTACNRFEIDDWEPILGVNKNASSD